MSVTEKVEYKPKGKTNEAAVTKLFCCRGKMISGAFSLDLFKKGLIFAVICITEMILFGLLNILN